MCLIACAGAHGLSISTVARGGFGEDGQPETPAAAATATENEQVNLIAKALPRHFQDEDLMCFYAHYGAQRAADVGIDES